jgi:hypothetical protein
MVSAVTGTVASGAHTEGLNVMPLSRNIASRNGKIKRGQRGQALKAAAEKYGVSLSYVSNALQIARTNDPDLILAMLTGAITVTGAANSLRRSAGKRSAVASPLGAIWQRLTDSDRLAPRSLAFEAMQLRPASNGHDAQA